MPWPKGKPRKPAKSEESSTAVETTESPDVGGAAVGNQNDARVALLNQMADAIDPEPVEEAAPAGVAAETVPEPVEAAAVVAEVIAPPRKLKIKVDGVEEELSEDELIAIAQKNRA